MSAQVKQGQDGQLWVRKDANSCWVKAQRTYNANGELIVHLPPEKVLPDSDIVVKTQSNTYNGWSNYETWAVNLHLTNNQYLYDTVCKFAKDGDYLKEWILSDWDNMLETIEEHGHSFFKGMLSDLLTSALQSVNWYEIYEGLHEEDESED